MSPVMELPGVLSYDMILVGRMPKEEQERRIRYARHELFLKLGDDIPDDTKVVIEASTHRELILADCMEKGSFYSEGDLRVRLRVHVRKLEQD